MSTSVLVVSASRYVEAFYRELAAGIPTPLAQERARQALHNNPYRHILRRYQNEEGKPVELRDWWVPHYYQQGPLLLQLATSTQQPQQQQSFSRLSRMNEEMPLEPRYGFIGRARELHRIERLLQQGKLVIISGFGGIGKTALACEAAEWLTRTKMYDGICFVSFEHGRDAVMLLSILGSYLDINDDNYHPLDLVATLRRLEFAQKEKHTLLIVDNLESILPDGEATLEIADRNLLWNMLLDLAKVGFGVLLTSRNPIVDGGLLMPGDDQVAQLALNGLHPEDAYAFASQILEELKIDRKHISFMELRELLIKLDHHPLAIQLVLPTLADLPPSTIQASLAELIPRFSDDTVRGRNRSLLVSLEYSMRRLSVKQRELLSHLAIFQGGAFEMHLLAITKIAGEEWTKLRSTLEEVALLTIEEVYEGTPVPPFLHFHPVLIPFLQSQVGEADTTLRRSYVRNYTRFVGEIYHEVLHDMPAVIRAMFQLELPNLRQTLELCLKDGKKDLAIVMIECMMRFFNFSGYELERNKLLQLVAKYEAVDISQGELDLPKYLLERHVADTEYRKGNLNAAYSRYTALLELIEAHPEGSDSSFCYGSSYHNDILISMSRCLRRGGQMVVAEDLIRKALLNIDKKLSTTSDVNYNHYLRARCTILTDLGTILSNTGRYLEARQVFVDALNISIQIKDLRQQAIILEGLGATALWQNDYREAKSLFIQVLQATRIAGGDQEIEANAWHNLGLVAQKQEKWFESEQYYRESLRIKDQMKNAASIAATCLQLANVTLASGHSVEAESWLKRALELVEQVQANSSLHAKVLYRLARLLMDEIEVGNIPFAYLTEAKNYAEKALAIDETLDVSKDSWSILSILCECYHKSEPLANPKVSHWPQESAILERNF